MGDAKIKEILKGTADAITSVLKVFAPDESVCFLLILAQTQKGDNKCHFVSDLDNESAVDVLRGTADRVESTFDASVSDSTVH